MFFTGDLQSGIGFALQESRSVACFITDHGEESLLWENEYLKDPQVTAALGAKAVTLRIQTGSQEAGFLVAYYPITQVPALMIIHNGQLTLQLYPGEARDTFKAAILKTLSTVTPKQSPQNLPAHSSSTSNTRTSDSQLSPHQHTPNLSPSGAETTAISATTTPPATSASNTESSTRPSSAVESLLADRRRKLDIDKKQKDAAETAARKANAEARKAAATSDPNSAKGKQATYAQQQRQRQYEAKLERERIVRQIEQDKIERKEKEERRKALIQAHEAETEAEGHEAVGSKTDSVDGPGGRVDRKLQTESGLRPTSSKHCALQVRLFDGSTLRNKFPSDQTLRTSVRMWIDQRRSDGDTPYTFKQILTPMPNRALSISDEEQSLQDLGLTPSATLVMVPIHGYTAAYADNAGLLSRGASAGYKAVSTGVGMVAGAVGTFLGLGQATGQAGGEETSPQQEREEVGPASRPSTTGSSINIRTLRDQQDHVNDHQFYNGNQLNFEPRRDDRDKED